jgi:hypothetical protein
MAGRLTRFDARLQVEEHLQLIEETLAGLTRRIQALEARTNPERAEPVQIALEGAHASPHARRDLSGVPALFGRTSLVLGGAFLLRAITDAGYVPATTGLVLGLVYASTWLIAAHRAAGPVSAVFHGATTLAIGLPIVWEAVLRFKTLSPGYGALALGLITVLPIAVAWHRRLQVLSAMAILGGLAVSLALMIGLREFGPFATVLIGMGAAGLAVGYGRGWMGQAFAAAVVVDLVMAFALLRAVAGSPPVALPSLLLLQAAFVTVFFGAFLTQGLLRHERLGVFAFVQAAATIAFGLGGAVAGSTNHAGIRLTIGILSAISAGVTYGLGVTSRVRRQSSSDTHFFTSMGLALAIAACGLLIPDALWPLSLAGAAIVLMWFGGQARLAALAAHSILLLFGAAVLFGLPSWVAEAWTSSTRQLPPASLPAFFTIASAVACFALSWRHAPSTALAAGRTMIGGLVLVVSGTAVLSWVAPLVATPRPSPDLIPTLRTAVLAGMACLAAWSARSRVSELKWLAYPLIAAGGLKLIVQDLRQSPPALVFVALTMFGVALILVSRALQSQNELRGPRT